MKATVAGTPSAVMASPVLNTIDPGAPMIISDIDHTIVTVHHIWFMLRRIEKVPPMADAARVLALLARTHQILYLTARSFWQIPKTVQWLAAHDFPTGPLIYRDTPPLLIPAGRYKSLALRRLRNRFTNIRWGIGDRLADVAAYADNNITPILIGNRSDAGRCAHVAQNWLDVERIITGSAGDPRIRDGSTAP